MYKESSYSFHWDISTQPEEILILLEVTEISFYSLLKRYRLLLLVQEVVTHYIK